MLKKQKEIQAIFSAQSKRFGVKIYRQANAGNHLHLILLPRSRDAFKGFIRATSGLIARAVTGKQRGISVQKKSDKSDPKTARGAGGDSRKTGDNSAGSGTASVHDAHLEQKSVMRFWDKRPFTRIVEWGKEFRGVSEYLLQNTLEALGFVAYKPRRHRKVAESTA